eukprot:m.225151 g.225151  ORF g.225151 m.225151 type:complete len:132 (-) comp16627_c0_seq1:143-538(-)
MSRVCRSSIVVNNWFSNMEAALTHTQRVLRLYRHALQHSRSWEVNRKLWRQEALALRERFEKHRGETNRIVAQQLLEAGEAEFEREKHPDPYKPCTALDGSKWERNIPPPHWACKPTKQEAEWLADKRYWQ